ncbi:hypothetical protein [Adhaeribacter radiodurans]|uniref:Uncharacterized protein n=1 Tax=Adhaeribacter radiodurans TaxID=2745197 RepID=A0A7L7LC16_9BACT|nr:hypothetical protein [Adhaeribacter radiodurans]QMU28238.1 hypothetical protein HUW48_09385 [Adhaeribacter radiodurans]QMU29563.1 hypothetical protein HUW48_16660 [Adhaeribacter radiodurans]QMU30361.1 hypothetical protein HUW48_21070 [Adhaeribacter radiodurans]
MGVGIRKSGGGSVTFVHRNEKGGDKFPFFLRPKAWAGGEPEKKKKSLVAGWTGVLLR